MLGGDWRGDRHSPWGRLGPMRPSTHWIVELGRARRVPACQRMPGEGKQHGVQAHGRHVLWQRWQPVLIELLWLITR